MSKTLTPRQVLMKPVCRAKGGIHPPHSKRAAEQPTRSIPLPSKVFIPLKQHIGVSCSPLVKIGDKVYVGSKIGDSDAPLSVPVHSSVSGTVEEIRLVEAPGGLVDAVVIVPDGNQTPDPEIKPIAVSTPLQLVQAARDCGLVGLGGAGFPTHIKLSPNPDQPIDTLIINAAECEPHITSDYRTCIEEPDLIMQGIFTLLAVLQPQQIILAIEDNKPKAIEVLVKIACHKQDAQNRVRVMKLPSHYPHGAEKTLVQVTTGRKIPPGKLPSAVGCSVMNVSGVAALQHYLNTGMPLTARRITVDGPAVKTPENLWVPIGTPISHLLAQVKITTPSKILMGGPMMGVAQLSTEAAIIKQNNAILVFDRKNDLTDHPQTPCIRCGRCASACPMSLMPTLIERYAKINNIDALRRVGVTVCMECGSCAYSCPAHRPLVQYMRLAKEIERKGRM